MKLISSRLKEIIECFQVLNHQIISVTTFSYQLSWIMFCNRYRFAPYLAQRKSEHAFHFFFHFFFTRSVSMTDFKISQAEAHQSLLFNKLLQKVKGFNDLNF